MKKEQVKIPKDELMKKFPIRAKMKGWFFNISEVSNGCWKISGSDRWNRRISLEGSDIDELIIEAEVEASRLKDGASAL